MHYVDTPGWYDEAGRRGSVVASDGVDVADVDAVLGRRDGEAEDAGVHFQHFVLFGFFPFAL